MPALHSQMPPSIGTNIMMVMREGIVRTMRASRHMQQMLNIITERTKVRRNGSIIVVLQPG